MSSDLNQRVLKALQKAKEKLAAIEQQKHEAVAIIGMAGRFPGAKNIEEYWHNLQQGVNSIQFLGDRQLLESGVEPELLKNTNYVRAYSSFDGIEDFDADFFGYSPREAELIDPQHRIFLETAWIALENAGYVSDRYRGKIGVFAGSALNTYLLNLYSSPELQKNLNSVQAVVSNVMGLMPTRVSYKLNLKGPSCGVQTGCSTSLVAVHLACQSLLNGELDMALAGGITVNSEGKRGYLYQEGSIASPDGYCRAFDREGKGTVFGNGVGIVVLKRLSEAVRDGDRIWATIKGSAINNDGADKVGLTAPSVTGQAEVIQTALQRSGVEPETISYIEAHGTGTPLGDPIEVAALNRVFRPSQNRQHRCAIGSVKTNFGHLDAAAGIAGLIKTVLALYHKQIPPSLNFEYPNPEIDFQRSPFYVNTQLADWQSNSTPRRAGVSSFGMGGTNAHVILEEPPVGALRAKPLQSQAAQDQTKEYLFVVSAKTQSALKTAKVNLADYLNQNPDTNLADVAYTLQVGRQAFDYRSIVVAKENTEAVEKLSQSISSQDKASGDRPITFLFSGQGSQYVGMAQELYQTEPVFRDNCDRCFQILQSCLDVSLLDVIYPALCGDGGDGHGGAMPLRDVGQTVYDIDQTQYAQPAIFAIEYALAQLWMHWGIKPDNAIGHSIGEYVAATLAGVFSLEDALKLVSLRGKLMQQCPPGAMLSVAMSADDLVEKIDGLLDLSLAVVNAPELSVVSGTIEAIAKFETILSQQGVACRRLHTSHGFHSPMMDEILPEFTAQVSKIQLNQPQLPFISNVTGTWITPEQATSPEYWTHHIRETVHFSRGIEQILQQPHHILLEVGAGKTLATLAQQHQSQIPSAASAIFLTSLPHPKQKISDSSFILNTLGKLWLSGIEVDWQNFNQNRNVYRIPLPSYPFERQRYWIDRIATRSNLTPLTEPDFTPTTKKTDFKDWFYLPSWQRSQPLNLNRTEKNSQTCLIVGSDSLITHLSERLQQLDCQVIIVRRKDLLQSSDNHSSKDDFCIQIADNSYQIDCQSSQAYLSLIENLRSSGNLPQKIVYCCSFEEKQNNTTHFQTIAPEFNRLIYLVQALTQQPSTTPIQLSVITKEIQEVVSAETIKPDQSMVLGACKVIPQEYPQIICHNIDLPQDITDRILDALVADILTLPTHAEIAYRHNYRWHRVISALPLVESQSSLIKQGGTYLIAGDMVEGLGLMYAERLAQENQANLVIIGRKDLPPQENWQQWLAQNPPLTAASCIKHLYKLVESGTEILFLSSNLDNSQAIAKFIAQANERFGKIDGVVYAGSMGDEYSCLIPSLTEEKIAQQFRSKVQGLVTLNEIFAESELDFFLVQSSLSAVVGGTGFAAYTAANIFTDSYVSLQNRLGKTPWFSINWDGYDSHQSSVSAHQSSVSNNLEQDSINNNYASTGLALVDLAINPDEAWEITQRVLSSGIERVIVTPTDLQPRIDRWITPKSLTEIDRLQASTSLNALANHAKPHVTTEYVAPRDRLEATVVNVMEELLGIDKIGVYDNFFELGGHSLLAIQIVSRLRDEFNVDIPMREFLFDSPTAAKIARVIGDNLVEASNSDQIEQLLEQVENLSDEEIQRMLE